MSRTHKDPEAGQRSRALHDTVESEHHTEEQCCDISRRLGIRQRRNDHVGECASEEHELYDEQKHKSLRLAVLVLPEHREVPRYPHEDGEGNLVGNLDGDVGDQEGDPTIGLGGAFADFVE